MEHVPTWDDPHNHDDRYTRVRVRERALPTLERELGPGLRESLARTAELLRDDDEALEEWAVGLLSKARSDAAGSSLDVAVLLEAPAAVRRRVLRAAAAEAGVPGGKLRASHLRDVDALVGEWSGQGEVHLPGGVRAWRSCGRLLFAPSTGAEQV